MWYNLDLQCFLHVVESLLGLVEEAIHDTPTEFALILVFIHL